MALVHLRELLHYTKKTQQEKALLHHRLHLKGLGAAWQSDQGSDPLAALQPEGVNRERIVAQWALLHRQAIAAELVEDPSGEHVYRVGRLAALLGAETGLDDDTCFMLELSARLHDIGKIGVPDAILAKRGSIDAEQQALVRTHVNIGAELLSQSGLDGIELAVDVTRHHHERWDGQGYPEGIAGGAIPEAARITALADVFDVMTHPRPYREALGIDEALAQIEKERGRRFDPELTDRFVAMIRRLRAEVGDLDEYLAQEARESPFIQARRKIAAALARAQAQGPLPRAAGGNSADAAADRV
jgi:putative two-component system response regulator